MIGKTFSHYRIVEKLGEGGMGVVYKARDTHLDRFVALKILPAERVADSERKRRFVQEAKAASSLNHPHIVTIYDIVEADGVHFIAMECVEGKTLDQMIPRHGMRLKEALKVAVQMADALAAAHEAGIVHRDLKPGNLMVTEKGHVKVLDFGLAKLTEEILPSAEDATLTAKPETEEGKIVGTVAYMSPEQAEGKKVDARSDIFSLGSVLYEMVSGKRPFEADSKASMLGAIIHKDPQPLSAKIPRDLEKVISRCLRKDIHRRFQHMDDVKIALEELKEESDSSKLASDVRPAGPSVLRYCVAAGLVVIAVAAAIWLLRPTSAVPEASPLTAIPLTSYTGNERTPTFSPDGTQVAFSWNSEKQDNYDIYVKPVDTGTPLRLTTNPADDSNPAWSGDGRWIAFLRTTLSYGNAAVILVPPLGGTERKLTEVHVRASDLLDPFLAWTPDSKHLVIVDRATPTDPSGLFLIQIDNAEKRRLIPPPPTSVGDSSPAFSPDGRTLAFTRAFSYALSDLYLVALTQDLRPVGEPRCLAFGKSDSRKNSPAWTPDGRYIVLVSGVGGGDTRLWRISSTAAAPPRPLATVGEGAISLALSRQGSGTRLAYQRGRPTRDILRLALGGGPASPFLYTTRDEHAARFSPDGKEIAFTSNRSGTSEIWIADNDGSNLVRLTSSGAAITDLPRWSPDGTRIAFHSRPEGQAEIFVMPASGGKAIRLTNDPAADVAPSWSRDGRWIYFGSARTGRQEIWKVPPEGGAPVQVTKNGGIAALESPDGQFLYYSRFRGITSLWRMPAGGGPENQVVESLFYLNYDVRPEGVYFIPAARPTADATIQLLLSDGGPVRTVASIERGVQSSLAVSPDGRIFLYSQSDSAGSDLMLVENFR